MGALNVFGEAPAGLSSFTETGIGDSFRPAEHIGKSVIVTVSGPKEVSTSYGVKTAISCSKVVVLGEEPQTFSDALIFSAAIVNQIKDKAGQTFVATIEAYDTKQGGKAPRFTGADAATIASAEAYLKAAA